MREMSTATTGCSQRSKLNEKAILLSSINSPLWICTLKSGGKLN
ncbi:FidL-like protein [Escherichia coli]